ncbi:MAG: hypothetical protein GF307_03575 [candidate division Zixibacteria bacterium]|nr:hypothetical protein [candidate division Zixibacteria bacterium]
MRVSSLRTGLILIGTGLILLGNTLGYIDWFVWGDLFKLWPALLIAIGIELIFRKSKTPALAYVSPLIILACFIYALAGDVALANGSSSKYKKEIMYAISDEQMEGIGSLDYRFDLSVGSFEFDSADSGVFLADLEYYGSKPAFDFENDDGEGEIELKYPKCRSYKSVGKNGCSSFLYLDDRKPTVLDINADVVEMALDLIDIEVTDLNIDSGVSDIMVRFGDKADYLEASFDIGVSELSVFIPENVAVRLRKDTGLASVSYKSLGLIKAGKGVYESPDYGVAPKKISLDIDAGISDIEVKYYSTRSASL